MNNAGIPGPVGVPIGNVEEADWDDVMNINLRAVWLCMKFEIAAMLAADGGSIVNVSSIYGYKSNPLGGGPYSASKHAVIGLTKSAAIDYAEQGLRFNVVAPGFVDTPILAGMRPEVLEGMLKAVPLRRVASTDEIYSAVRFILECDYFTGRCIDVDGGMTL